MAESEAGRLLIKDLDPDFAVAYARLGAVYGNLANSALADEYLTKAFERRQHVSEREKFYIAGHYYADSTRDGLAGDLFPLTSEEQKKVGGHPCKKLGVGSIKGPKGTCRSSPASLGFLSADLKQADAIALRILFVSAIFCLCTSGTSGSEVDTKSSASGPSYALSHHPSESHLNSFRSSSDPAGPNNKSGSARHDVS